MWFNSREQKQIEIHQIELARDWTQRNTSLIDTLIESATQKGFQLLEGKETDEEWDLKRRLSSPNPHQRPVCHPVIENIPESSLAPGMVKYLGHTLYVNTDHWQIGNIHSDIRLDDIHIDPTFGQFFPGSFEWVLKRHAKLFQNGILVARTKDIAYAFNIEYK